VQSFVSFRQAAISLGLKKDSLLQHASGSFCYDKDILWSDLTQNFVDRRPEATSEFELVL
jgi:hypothetical protein